MRRTLKVTISVGRFLEYFSGDNIISVGNNFFFLGELDVAAYSIKM